MFEAFNFVGFTFWDEAQAFVKPYDWFEGFEEDFAASGDLFEDGGSEGTADTCVAVGFEDCETFEFGFAGHGHAPAGGAYGEPLVLVDLYTGEVVVGDVLVAIQLCFFIEAVFFLKHGGTDLVDEFEVLVFFYVLDLDFRVLHGAKKVGWLL